MTSKEASRARVLYSNDPLQLNKSRSDAWALPNDPTDPQVLQDWPTLARQDRWERIGKESAAFQSIETDMILSTAAWHVVSQIKLRDFRGAAQTLATLGDLDAPEYTRMTSKGPVSRIPFALRRAACECQAGLGNITAYRDTLYSLLDFCRRKQIDSQSGLWRFREECIAATIFCFHYRESEYNIAFQWFSWLQSRYPRDIGLQLTLACLQISVGLIQRASATIQEAVRWSLEDGQAETFVDSLRIVKGLLLFAQNNLAGSGAAFQEVSQTSDNRAGANNMAVIHVHSGSLQVAAKLLENCLQENPKRAIQESIVSNLATLYDLTGQESKTQFAEWLARVGPDDLSVSSLS